MIPSEFNLVISVTVILLKVTQAISLVTLKQFFIKILIRKVLKYDRDKYAVHFFLTKNFSQRQFNVTYGFHTCQRFYRKIKNSPNFSWKETQFQRIAEVNFHYFWKRIIHNTRTVWKIFRVLWRNLANFFLSCDKIFDTCESHR